MSNKENDKLIDNALDEVADISRAIEYNFEVSRMLNDAVKKAFSREA